MSVVTKSECTYRCTADGHRRVQDVAHSEKASVALLEEMLHLRFE